MTVIDKPSCMKDGYYGLLRMRHCDVSVDYINQQLIKHNCHVLVTPLIAM